MTTATLKRELHALPEAERALLIGSALKGLSPASIQALERQVRRLAHPEVPEDVWIGFEEAEAGLGIEIKDGHFANVMA